MTFKIIRNDISKMETEAIVNAANTRLEKGGGVCGAIFKGASSKELEKECQKIGGCKPGQAVITKVYNLPAKYIIHTVGPIWRGGNANEDEILYSAYKSSLELARENKIESIAFPLISAGIYGFPKDRAMSIAMAAIGDFLLKYEMDIYLVVYENDIVLLSKKFFNEIEEYINDNYVYKRREFRDRDFESFQDEYIYEENLNLEINIQRKESSLEISLDNFLEEVKDTFSEMLLKLIDEKGMTDVETYKKANIDRRLFSKIRSQKNYSPSKETALAFAIALELSLDESEDLLGRAGYALSPSHKFDLIIKFFIENENYNIYKINEALFSFGEKTLN